ADRGADRVVVLDRLRPGERTVEGRVALGQLLGGGLGGQLAERPGGDDDGIGHGSGGGWGLWAVCRRRVVLTNPKRQRGRNVGPRRRFGLVGSGRRCKTYPHPGSAPTIP